MEKRPHANVADVRSAVVLSIAFALLGEVAYRESFAGAEPMRPLEMPLPNRPTGGLLTLGVLLVYVFVVARISLRSPAKWLWRVCAHVAVAALVGMGIAMAYYRVRIGAAPPVWLLCADCETSPYAFVLIPLWGCAVAILAAPFVGGVARSLRPARRPPRAT